MNFPQVRRVRTNPGCSSPSAVRCVCDEEAGCVAGMKNQHASVWTFNAKQGSRKLCVLNIFVTDDCNRALFSSTHNQLTHLLL